MTVNPHLRSLDHVIGLAQAEANITKKDQAIYKTKDAKLYEIFQFVPEKDFKGIAVRVVRYTRENKHESVLQDSGNEQPIAVSKKSGTGKAGKPRTSK